jgi:hypothetical protein
MWNQVCGAKIMVVLRSLLLSYQRVVWWSLTRWALGGCFQSARERLGGHKHEPKPTLSDAFIDSIPISLMFEVRDDDDDDDDEEEEEEEEEDDNEDEDDGDDMMVLVVDHDAGTRAGGGAGGGE